jgi:hypothetical protein
MSRADVLMQMYSRYCTAGCKSQGEYLYDKHGMASEVVPRSLGKRPRLKARTTSRVSTPSNHSLSHCTSRSLSTKTTKPMTIFSGREEAQQETTGSGGGNNSSDQQLAFKELGEFVDGCLCWWRRTKSLVGRDVSAIASRPHTYPCGGRCVHATVF